MRNVATIAFAAATVCGIVAVEASAGTIVSPRSPDTRAQVVVPVPKVNGSLQQRNAFVQVALAAWRKNSTVGPSPQVFIERQRRKLQALPSGTRLYYIPGFEIRSGEHDLVLYLPEGRIARTASGYDVSQSGTFIDHFPPSAEIHTFPAALTYYVSPGHPIPSRFVGQAPAFVAP